MKSLFVFLIFAAKMVAAVHAQNGKSNTPRYLLVNTAKDTNDIWLLLNSSEEYCFTKPDTGLLLAQKALELSRYLHYTKGEVYALSSCGEAFNFMGDYPQALKKQFEALQISRELKDQATEADCLGFIGILYNELGEYRQALQYLLLADKISKKLSPKFEEGFILSNLGDAYSSLKIRDSALYYQRKAYEQFSDTTRTHLKSFILRHMGAI